MAAERRTPSRMGGRLAFVFAFVVVAGVRLVPISGAGMSSAESSEFTFLGADAGRHVYPGGRDGYEWLRRARNIVSQGSSCDAEVNGVCRDELTLAPVGARMTYAASLHPWAIATVHRAAVALRPGFPIETSAAVLTLLVALLGVYPAFDLGRRLGGAPAGFVAAIAVGTNPLFLVRSATPDNDVWNVVLPLSAIWALVRTVSATPRSRVLWILAGVVGLGCHASIWRGWLLTLGIVAGAVGVAGLAHEVRHRRWTRSLGTGLWGRSSSSLLVAAIGLLGVLLVASLLAFESVVAWLDRTLFDTAFFASRSAAGDWPSALATVNELARPTFARVAALMGGAAWLFVAWLGALILVLPDGRWRPPHFAILLVGNYLLAYLVVAEDPAPGLAMTGLILVWLAAVVARSVAGESVSLGAATVGVWFLVGCALAFEGLRFVMLLVPAFGLGLGVATGRGVDWVMSFVRLRGGWDGWVKGAAALLVVLPLLEQSGTAARHWRPRMHGAWWDTFAEIRATTATGTIVAVWWPYGYWAKHVAERRVLADGASLPTHVPHWMGRSLLAEDPGEALGLLRMLACGSDATPMSGKERGAFYGLTSRGVDPAAAHELVVTLATRGRADAAELLAGRGFGLGEREQLLAATHCPPPPMVLVLTTEMLRTTGWRVLGDWSPASSRPPSQALPAESLLARLIRDPESLPRFEFVDGRSGARGERVLVWQVLW